MRVLVTGAEGFIGGYLTGRLRADGHEVILYRHSDGDLRDKGSLDGYDGVDAVYHLAAKTFVPESWDDPSAYIADNNSILINVLEFCRRAKACMIFISTYMYGEPEYLPIDEKHRCVMSTPYHLSKKIGEEICEFYSTNFGVDVAVARPFNVYGKGQNREFLLPKVYYQVADRGTDEVSVFTLAPKRDYVYVEDVADALARLLPHVSGYDIYNIGSGVSYSVKEAIDIIQTELGTKKKITEKHSVRKNEVMDCVADVSHLTEVIGDLSITPFAEGIRKWHMLEE
ncbi:MAG: NAD-dependent epimerase/dehydratase family protein [Lachnospiraceae bacterium]|nr:NAD-dependent epimerase/dehydratase family protein [Lachnospiraceae bacterium]